MYKKITELNNFKDTERFDKTKLNNYIMKILKTLSWKTI